jgi:hypothetical protein
VTKPKPAFTPTIEPVEEEEEEILQSLQTSKRTKKREDKEVGGSDSTGKLRKIQTS